MGNTFKVQVRDMSLTLAERDNAPIVKTKRVAIKVNGQLIASIMLGAERRRVYVRHWSASGTSVVVDEL